MKWVALRRRLPLSILVVSFATVSTTWAEDWPCFRGPGRQGVSLEKGVPTQWSQSSNVKWKTPLPGEGWSSPIVFDDAVFVTTATDGGKSYRLVRLDRTNGSILWDKEVTQQTPKYKQRPNSYATSTPATDGQRVYMVACDGQILATDMEGNVAWKNSEFDYYSQHGLATSPVLYKDLVIVVFDWSSPGPDKKIGWEIPWDKAVILALDKSTGKVRWRGSRGSSQIAHTTPQIATVDGRDQLVTSAGGVVQGFDLKTGERIWTVSSPGEGVVPSPVVGDGMSFSTTGFREETILAVRLGGRGDITQTHVAWRVTEEVPHVPSLLYVSPRLYSITDEGIVNCIEGTTGKVLWRERIGSKFSASPVCADGKVYFLSEKGKATIVEEGPQFKVLAENELGETCCASPAVSQGNLFIRTEKALYCIGK
ncbi:MAG TPA: PQQ-binding-like beta-propeller repeat protein [Sedimentisphaerales bacterium]|jgi:outer membrane protein assembly factor BamB|nr:PQQ-binding-like beta-propeller repeat protein [Sedimentisphaerales bacterium]HNU29970.1 PQQ-binding-like beta-propeller repeat protein [Sedimentisphaerales bacterium]